MELAFSRTKPTLNSDKAVSGGTWPCNPWTKQRRRISEILISESSGDMCECLWVCECTFGLQFPTPTYCAGWKHTPNGFFVNYIPVGTAKRTVLLSSTHGGNTSDWSNDRPLMALSPYLPPAATLGSSTCWLRGGGTCFIGFEEGHPRCVCQITSIILSNAELTLRLLISYHIYIYIYSACSWCF